jgi:tetratricopeptide (TPR) repeat protein
MKLLHPPESQDESHLTEETLAQIAEHGLRANTEPRIVRHLARCRSCMSAYCDAVRYRTALAAAPEWFAGGAPPSPPRRSRRGLPLSIAAGLMLTLGISAAVWFARPRSAPGGDSGALAQLLERASVRGLVLPGGEQHWHRDLVVYRGAKVPDRSPLLERLRTRYETSQNDGETLYQLAAGLTASRQFGAANDYITEGLAQRPDDARFVVLAAVLARERGQLANAASLLSLATLRHPEDPTVALNLALVQLERGDHASARRLLDDLGRRALPPVLEARAAEARRRSALQ